MPTERCEASTGRGARPEIKVFTGISVDVGASTRVLLDRARRQAKVVYSGKRELSFLVREHVLETSPLVVIDGQYVFLVRVPPPDQRDLFVGEWAGPAAVEAAGIVGSQVEGVSARRSLSSTEVALAGQVDGMTDLPLPSGLGQNQSDEVIDLVNRIDHAGNHMPSVNSGTAPPTGVDSGTVKGLHGQANSRASPETLNVLTAPVGESESIANDIQASADLLDRVAELLSTSSDPELAIKSLEEKEKVKTAAIRGFHFGSQRGFSWSVGEREIAFKKQDIRALISTGSPVDAEVHLVVPNSEVLRLAAEVIHLSGRGLPRGVEEGGAHVLRFVGLDDLQYALLLLYRWSGRYIEVTLRETVSVRTLRHTEVDVVAGPDWSAMLREALIILGDAHFNPPRSVAQNSIDIEAQPSNDHPSSEQTERDDRQASS